MVLTQVNAKLAMVENEHKKQAALQEETVMTQVKLLLEEERNKTEQAITRVHSKLLQEEDHRKNAALTQEATLAQVNSKLAEEEEERKKTQTFLAQVQLKLGEEEARKKELALTEEMVLAQVDAKLASKMMEQTVPLHTQQMVFSTPTDSTGASQCYVGQGRRGSQKDRAECSNSNAADTADGLVPSPMEISPGRGEAQKSSGFDGAGSVPDQADGLVASGSGGGGAEKGCCFDRAEIVDRTQCQVGQGEEERKKAEQTVLLQVQLRFAREAHERKKETAMCEQTVLHLNTIEEDCKDFHQRMAKCEEDAGYILNSLEGYCKRQQEDGALVAASTSSLHLRSKVEDIRQFVASTRPHTDQTDERYETLLQPCTPLEAHQKIKQELQDFSVQTSEKLQKLSAMNDAIRRSTPPESPHGLKEQPPLLGPIDGGGDLEDRLRKLEECFLVRGDISSQLLEKTRKIKEGNEERIAQVKEMYVRRDDCEKIEKEINRVEHELKYSMGELRNNFTTFSKKMLGDIFRAFNEEHEIRSGHGEAVLEGSKTLPCQLP